VTVTHHVGKDVELRLAIFDMDDDDKYTESDLLGEAFIKLSALADKAALPLSKGGKALKEGSTVTVGFSALAAAGAAAGGKAEVKAEIKVAAAAPAPGLARAPSSMPAAASAGAPALARAPSSAQQSTVSLTFSAQ
jgi:hypothetical protein